MSYKNISEDVWIEETPSFCKFTARNNSAYLTFDKEIMEDVYNVIKDVRKNKQTDNHACNPDINVNLNLSRLRRNGVNIYNLNKSDYGANNWFCKKLDIVIGYLNDRVLTFDKLKEISKGERNTIKELLKDYSVKSLERILKEVSV